MRDTLMITEITPGLNIVTIDEEIVSMGASPEIALENYIETEAYSD